MLLLATKCVCAHYAVIYSALGGIAMSCTVGISITQARIASIVSETPVHMGGSLPAGDAGIESTEFNLADPSVRLCWRSESQGKDTAWPRRLIQQLCPDPARTK